MALSKLEREKEQELFAAEMMHDELIALPADRQQELVRAGFWTREDYTTMLDIARVKRNIEAKYRGRRKRLKERFAGA